MTTPDADRRSRPRTRAYGDLPPGATVSRDFTLTLAASHPLGKACRLAVRVTFAGVLSPTQATFKVGAGQPATTPVKFSYTGPPVPIPDASTLGASIPIAVTGVAMRPTSRSRSTARTCSEDPASTTVGINHSYVGDLTGTLTSPAGKTAVLFQRRGGDGREPVPGRLRRRRRAAVRVGPRRRRPVHRHLEAARSAGALIEDAVDGTGRSRSPTAPPPTPAPCGRSRCH